MLPAHREHLWDSRQHPGEHRAAPLSKSLAPQHACLLHAVSPGIEPTAAAGSRRCPKGTFAIRAAHRQAPSAQHTRSSPCHPPALQHSPACYLPNPWGLNAGCSAGEGQSSREKQKTAQWPQERVWDRGMHGMGTLPLPGDTVWGRQQAGKPLRHRQARTWVQRCRMGQGRPCSSCHHGHAEHESPGCRGSQRCAGHSCWQAALPTCSRGRQPDFKYVLNYSWHNRGSWSTRS